VDALSSALAQVVYTVKALVVDIVEVTNGV